MQQSPTEESTWICLYGVAIIDITDEWLSESDNSEGARWLRASSRYVKFTSPMTSPMPSRPRDLTERPG